MWLQLSRVQGGGQPGRGLAWVSLSRAHTTHKEAQGNGALQPFSTHFSGTGQAPRGSLAKDALTPDPTTLKV